MGKRKNREDPPIHVVNDSGTRYFRKMLGRINLSNEWGKEQGVEGFQKAVSFIAEKSAANRANRSDNGDLSDFTIMLLDEFSEIIRLDLFDKIDMDDWKCIPKVIREMLLSGMLKGTLDELSKGKVEKIFVLDSVTAELLEHDHRTFLFFRRKIRESISRESESRIRELAIEKEFCREKGLNLRRH